ncbi:MAG: efflux RND transporter periplasmic adaptor subunit [Fimbriimonadaceae bacterium]|nr:efflux RND transporter periplasmic adaptor subunit [Chthonomonadaceae bacterium]MCO5296029.1 efflux RND transporter periplasmic adaptor subunit [Fimbriimonadaceae bacterium]
MDLRLGVVACAVFALAASGCVNREAQAQAKQTKELLEDTTRPVDTVEVARRDVAQSIEITGTIATSEDVTIGAQQPGRLTAVYVRDGDSVRVGQLLASQDTSDLAARVRQAQAQVDAARSSLDQAATNARVGPTRSSAGVQSAQAQLRQAQAQLDKLRNGARPEEIAQAQASVDAARSNVDTAKKSLDRMRQLFEAGAVSRQSLDAAENQYQTAQSQYESAEQGLQLIKQMARTEDIAAAREQVRQAEQAVRSARAQQQLDPVLDQQVQGARANLDAAMAALQLQRQALEDLQIRSPFAGRVSGKPVQPGTYLAPGTPVLRLVGVSGVYFEGDVPEGDVAQVATGQTVRVRIDALDRTLTGRVAAINPQGDVVGRLFKVRVALEGDTAEIRPGMFARGTLDVRSAKQAAVVPAVALVREGTQSYVFVVRDGVAKKTAVVPGIRDGDLIQVNGIDEGDVVVVRGQNLLGDGTKVLVENKA